MQIDEPKSPGVTLYADGVLKEIVFENGCRVQFPSSEEAKSINDKGLQVKVVTPKPRPWYIRKK